MLLESHFHYSVKVLPFDVYQIPQTLELFRHLLVPHQTTLKACLIGETEVIMACTLA